MERYWSGLLVSDEDRLLPKPLTGSGWQAVVDDQPSDMQPRHRQPGIYIIARSHENAQRAVELIWSSLFVIHSGGIDLYEYPEARPVDEAVDKVPPELQPFRNLRTYWTCQFFAHTMLACKTAAKAARDLRSVYAIHSLALSQSLAATHYMVLDPSHWRFERAVSPFPRDHLRLANAIITAYAAIENLGLEVRASTKRPSFKEGKWNPEVRQDLESRLDNRGINRAEAVSWTVRGPPRRVEKSRQPNAIRKASWAGRWIRDIDIAVVDAIAQASWLRSRVSAHAVRDNARSLTHYDVANCQVLARRLILEVLGVWRIWDGPDDSRIDGHGITGA